MAIAAVDRSALESKVKSMYSDVVVNPRGEFHFEMGREMAERLGYGPQDLDRIPADAIDSFAGVGTSSISRTCMRVSGSWTSAVVPEWTASSPRSRSDRQARCAAWI